MLFFISNPKQVFSTYIYRIRDELPIAHKLMLKNSLNPENSCGYLLFLMVIKEPSSQTAANYATYTFTYKYNQLFANFLRILNIICFRFLKT